MRRSLNGIVIGALALAGASLASTDGQAMPVQPLGLAASHASDIDHIYWRGYGYRRGFYRGGYGWRGGYGFPLGYGFRPYGYGYGWRRPFYRYGYRRW